MAQLGTRLRFVHRLQSWCQPGLRSHFKAHLTSKLTHLVLGSPEVLLPVGWSLVVLSSWASPQGSLQHGLCLPSVRTSKRRCSQDPRKLGTEFLSLLPQSVVQEQSQKPARTWERIIQRCGYQESASVRQFVRLSVVGIVTFPVLQIRQLRHRADKQLD